MVLLPWLLDDREGTNTVYLRYRDDANNVAYTNDWIILDRLPPSGVGVSINAGAGYTSNTAVTLAMSATDLYLTDMRVANAPNFAGSSWVPFVGTTNWILTAGDGTKTVYAQFRDAVGNTSVVTQASIIYDATRPALVAVAMNADPTKAGSITSSVLFADAPAGMNTALPPTARFVTAQDRTGVFAQVSYSGNTWIGQGMVLGGDDGVAFVDVLHAADKAGNVMLPAYQITNFLIDTEAPTNVAVVINSGSIYANGASVTLQISAQDALPMEMMLGNDAGFSGGVWEPYATSKAWTLAAGDGVRTVYVKFRDVVLNETAVVSDSIMVDTTPPSAVAVTISGGAGYTSNTTVVLTLSATDLHLTDMRIANAPSFAGAAWVAFAANTNWTLPAGDGTKTVYAQYRDVVGNTSAVAQTSIVYDATRPVLGTISLNADPTKAGSITAAVSFADATAGMDTATVPTMYFATVGGRTGWFGNLLFTGNVWRATATVIGGDDGLATIDLTAAKDRSGNVLLPVYAATNLFVDTTEPTNRLVIINAGATYVNKAAVTLQLHAEDALSMQMMLGNDAGFSGGVWEPYATSKVWTLAAGDGVRTVYVKFRDVVLNESAVVSDSIIVDTTPPSAVAVTINGGAACTSNILVTLGFSANDPYLADMRFSENSDFSGAGWQAYATSQPFLLAPVEGTRTVYAQFRDLVGNTSTLAQTSIIYDATRPGVASIVIAPDPSTIGAVTLTVTFADAPAGMDTTRPPAAFFVTADARTGTFSHANYLGNTWKGIGNILLADDGMAMVSVQSAVDRAGNMLLPAADLLSFTIDTLVPSNISVVINDGAEQVNGSVVTLTIHAEDASAVQMMIGNDAGFSGSVWEPYATSKAWTLAAGDGVRTVYVKFRDALRNQTGTISDSIVVDASAPSSTTIVINGGATYASNSTVQLTLHADDAGSIEMQIANNATFAGAVWEPYAVSKGWVLTPADGTRTVYARFRDNLLNQSGSVSDSIIVDTTPPSAASVTINNGTAVTSNRNVRLSLAATDVYLTDMRVSENADFTGAGWQSFVTSLSFTLSAGDGIKRVHAQFRDIVNNVSGIVHADILLDSSKPFVERVALSVGHARAGAITATVWFADVSTGMNTGVVPYVYYTCPAGRRTFSQVNFASNVWLGIAQVQVGDDGSASLSLELAQDNAGNVIAPVTGLSPFVIDTVPPSSPSITINNNDAYALQRVVTLALYATDNSALEMMIADTPSFSGAAWETFVGTKTWTLPAGDSLRTVYVQFRDSAGNLSAVASDAISLNTVPPTFWYVSDGTYTDKVDMLWTVLGGVTFYEVYRNTINVTGTASLLVTSVSTQYIDHAVQQGTLYYYWVRGVNNHGATALSSLDTGYARLDVPLTVDASDGVYTNKVRIVWEGVAHAIGYKVYRLLDAAPLHVGYTTNTFYDDLSAVPGTNYYYSVKASTPAGDSHMSDGDNGYALVGINAQKVWLYRHTKKKDTLKTTGITPSLASYFRAGWRIGMATIVNGTLTNFYGPDDLNMSKNGKKWWAKRKNDMQVTYNWNVNPAKEKIIYMLWWPMPEPKIVYIMPPHSTPGTPLSYTASAPLQFILAPLHPEKTNGWQELIELK
jgi:hypothetical protein